MFKLLIADLVVEIDNKYNYINNYCQKYIYTGDKPTDIYVSISDQEIQQEYANSDEDFTEGYLESICAYRKIATALPKFDAFVLHSAVIQVEGKGIAFLASSGTGKTTHLLFWHKLCDESLKVVNGDKPIVRIIDGVPYAFGTPWSGKEGYNSNRRTILTDLCFIERAEKDEVINISGLSAAMLLMNQVYRPNNASMLDKTYNLANELLKSCNLRRVKCTNNISAAKTAYEAIFK